MGNDQSLLTAFAGTCVNRSVRGKVYAFIILGSIPDGAGTT